MLTSEDIDRINYPEIGERVIENCGVIEQICKFIILSIAKYTWPFVTGSYIIIASYVVYGR